jgi:nucleoside-diphosphate-sugar epimerase
MRIAITGGAGFIGSHLCEQLLREGHEIFCIDNFYTGNNENIKYISSNNNFHLILADISKLKYMGTQLFILKQKIIGAMLIQQVSEVATTKANAVQKLYALTIIGNMALILK